MRFFVLVCIFYLFLPSCGTFDFSDQPQGVIEYDVTYLSNNSSMPTNLLPKKVTLKFRANKSITTIDGFMGMFVLSNICDFRKHTNTMILKVVENKFFYQGEKYESPFFFDGLNDPIVALTNQTQSIAGVMCKKALVSFKDAGRKPFDIFFTDSIHIKNPNKSNPFSEIEGVLMQFNIRLNNIEMQLKASKYKNENVSSDIFTIPDNYKKVSREKMSGVLVRLLE